MKGSKPSRHEDAVDTLRRTLQRRPAMASPLVKSVVAVAALSLVALGFLELAALRSPAPGPWWLELDPDLLGTTVSESAEVVAAVLALAITVVAIVVELAATRFSHRITFLFVREPLNLAVMGLYVITTLLCLWVGLAAPPGDALGALVTLLLVSLSLLTLLPYLAWVFSFISPLSVIDEIRGSGLRAVRKGRQAALLEAVDELQEIARGALSQQDRSIAMAAVNALTDLLVDYQPLRTGRSPDWFRAGPAVRQDPDFVSLEPSSVEDIEGEGLWVEVKICRQFIGLVPFAVPDSRDVANLIAINTRGIGVMRGSPALRALALRCFNSYLRATINARDPRTAYYIFHQYRKMAEELLDQGDGEATAEIAEHFQFYGILGYAKEQGFLLEVAAHDLVELIELCATEGYPWIDRLLDRLLELDQEFRTETQEESLLGVRRAQVQAAVSFLDRDDLPRATRVVDDLRNESPRRLERIRRQLESEEREQYWEFTDRGANFAYLAPERRPHLGTLFELLEERRRAGDGASSTP